MRELDAGVVVGQDVVIAVLAAVGGKLCYRARLLRGHLDGAKLLQEQLVVVSAHHQQLVDEDVDGHWGVGLQRLCVVISSVLLHRVSGLVATATRDAYRAAALEAVGGTFELRVRTGERGSRESRPAGTGDRVVSSPVNPSPHAATADKRCHADAEHGDQQQKHGAGGCCHGNHRELRAVPTSPSPWGLWGLWGLNVKQ